MPSKTLEIQPWLSDWTQSIVWINYNWGCRDSSIDQAGFEMAVMELWALKYRGENEYYKFS
ncbi:hypothetical protein WN55_03330 [Dufourea novaeangliae]|uniref:Uncharacterized protein n=1 Tax=Dufourea novaeangliae TaxID=178035 RepID=A0A154PLE7_DUFNO|nr:hypothetical protein WN55_03330 [Dufourea novaeangliae]